MELPRRTRGDELLRPGEPAAIRLRFVIACAFDHRIWMRATRQRFVMESSSFLKG